MENKIKVSIVIPAYNVENYIEACIKSLVNQTLKDIEIIIIDDGSKDKTSEIITKYAQEDFRIKNIKQENQGISAARNLGISLAKGEYIGFVDSDDWIDANYFENLYNTAIKYNADMAVASIYKHKPKYNQYTLEYKTSIVAEKIQDKIKLCEDKKKRFFYVWNKLCKAELLKENNIQFAIGRIYEDVNFTMQTVFYANKIVSATDTKYHYIERSGSIINTKKKTEKNGIDHDFAYKELQKFAKNNKFKLSERLNYYTCYWKNPFIKIYLGTYKKKITLFGLIPIFIIKSEYEIK